LRGFLPSKKLLLSAERRIDNVAYNGEVYVTYGYERVLCVGPHTTNSLEDRNSDTIIPWEVDPIYTKHILRDS
jgi:hypothetical protein